MKLSIPTTDFSNTLPNALWSLMVALCKHYQVDLALAIPSILGMCSALIHSRFKVRVYDHVTNSYFDEPLSLFCIGIASSSERKSPLLKWLKAPIQRELELINLDLEKEHTKLNCERKIAEDEAKKLRKKISMLPVDSPQRAIKMNRLLELENTIKQTQVEFLRLFLQDSTAIAAATFMQKQIGNSLVVADAEGGSFDAISSDHRLLELLISGFSNEGISFERSSRPSVNISSPHAGLCILTQEIKLHRLAKKTDSWNEGFIPRSLIFLAQEKAGFRNTAIGETIPQDVKEWWQKKCQSFLNLEHAKDSLGKRDYYVLHMSPEAAQVWRNFSSHLEGMMQPNTATYHLRAWLGKMAGVSVRIAALYHMFETEQPLSRSISARHMQLACNMIFAAQLHMTEVAKLYFPVDDTFTHAVHKIINWLKQEEGTIAFFKLREMYRQLNIKSKLAHQACGYLLSLGVLHLGFVPEANFGRNSSPVYSVNYYNLNTHFPLMQY